MAYRKLKAGNLFTGTEMLEGDLVLVTDEEGTVLDIIPASEAGDGIEKFEGILSPGFVNCHCHLELSHMKGLIPSKTGLVDFLLSVVKKRTLAEDIVQQAIADAEQEMLDNGIVAVGDICNTADTISQKQLGNLYYHNFIETIGFIEASAQQRFDSSLSVFKQFAQLYSLPIESNSIVPHAPYSVSNKLFGLIANFPGNHVISIHNQETEAENEFFQLGAGDFFRLYKEMGLDISSFIAPKKRSLENYLPHFYPNQTMLLVHNVATNNADLDWLRENHPSPQNIFFCLCPNANEYISGKMPDIDLLIEKKCKMVVGTDSLASNQQLNILEELKTIQQHFPHILTSTLLQWATKNGAEALQLESILGSFEKGKQPGVLLIENLTDGKLNPASVSRKLL